MMIRLSSGIAANPRFQLFNPHKPIPLHAQTALLKKKNFSKTRDGDAFDAAAYESERLSLDAAAMEVMAETARKEIESDQDNDDEDDPKAWKWIIRKKMWDLMEARNYAVNPRPVHHRIPNFVGAPAAAAKVRERLYNRFFRFFFLMLKVANFTFFGCS